MHLGLALLVMGLQGQSVVRPAMGPGTVGAGAETTPPSGDTTGYWQQRIRFDARAVLDEQMGGVHATARLTYVNCSPDTLREMFVHQYLNAFRPASRWSDVDAREGRVRFQNLKDPDYGYERFTAAPRVSAGAGAGAHSRTSAGASEGIPVQVDYPFAPDSTVAHFALPAPLAPGDSIVVSFAWDARLSTVPRRQGRKGRMLDFAHWFPKVAVYDRHGWEPNVLVPAGEFYGEYGTYDVTMVVPGDQVIVASGVPVSGDPGWKRALRWGAVPDESHVYAHLRPAAVDTSAPAGFKAVRFVARDVHHFAWSVSPDYRYEGGVYVRGADARPSPVAHWDTVALNVFWRPGDDTTWGGGIAIHRLQTALAWLEHVYGPYAWPQLSTNHRLDGGGTEEPMLIMNGGASQGLILHEGGHMYSMGILGNNEWASGWMDEGLTSFQTAWYWGDVRSGPDTTVPPRPPDPAPPLRHGFAAWYRSLGIPRDALAMDDANQYRLDLIGRAQPIGTRANAFNEFPIYNQMIYDRGQMMYGQLHNAIGDAAMHAFFHRYYDTWALKHVDELAMRHAAEVASGEQLGWFFDQWVHHTGLIDYALDDVRSRRDGDGWVTTAEVQRVGEYRHPMPVGVRTDSGWTIVRAAPLPDEQSVTVRTSAEPRAVMLDPMHRTDDWFEPNNYPGHWYGRPSHPRVAMDWPFLTQAMRDQWVTAFAPLWWRNTGAGQTAALRVRSNYQDSTMAQQFAVGWAERGESRDALALPSRLQLWSTAVNPMLPWMARPLMGTSFGVWHVDGLAMATVSHTWDDSPYLISNSTRISRSVAFTVTGATDTSLVDRLRWSGLTAADLGVGYAVRTADPGSFSLRAGFALGLTSAPAGSSVSASDRVYTRVTVEASHLTKSANAREVTFVRLFAAVTHQAPLERAVYLASQNPTEAFANPWLRAPGSPLSEPAAHYTPLGGAGLRGFAPGIPIEQVISANVEQAEQLFALGPRAHPLRVYVSAFGDAAYPLGARVFQNTQLLSDAGVGVSAKGRVFDRDVTLRFDAPLYVSEPYLGVGLGTNGKRPTTTMFRWVWSMRDWW